MRFFSEAKPGEDVLSGLCDSSDPQKGMTLLVWRAADDGEPRIIATGSYLAINSTDAEFAVAVDDFFQGKGLGGLLLERLSVLAASHGFTRFNAFTDARNQGMLETFRHSGFELREEFQDGMVEVHLSVKPGKASFIHASQRDRLFTKSSLRPFFAPKSIAVIGASRDPAKPGHRIFMTILRQQFQGVVYPVNPLARQISGVKAYPTAADLPDPVDLAILAVPRDQVLATVDQCAQRGIRALIVLTAGFAERDDQGRVLQEALLARVRDHGMRMLGPNCLGLVNTDPGIQLNASLTTLVPGRGHLAISSQSGALGMALLRLVQNQHLGISSFVSTGNKADVTGNDLLYFWEDDPDTHVILLYVESFGNPRRFGRIAREVSRRKPIVCVKPNRRDQPHDHIAVQALFKQSGIIRSQTLDEMLDVAALLSTQPLPAGPRFTIITNSHGAAMLCRDTAEAEGLCHVGLEDLSASATPQDYILEMQKVVQSGTTDALIMIYLPVGENDVSSFIEMLSASAPANLPVLLVLMTPAGTRMTWNLPSGSYPGYVFPESAAHALAAAAHYRAWRDAPPGMIPDFDDADIERARQLIREQPAGNLPQAVAAELLASIGLHSTPHPDACADVNIEVNQDPVFGPVMAFSLSGYHHDMLNDSSFRIIPLTDLDAANMVESIRAFPLLAHSGAHRETLHEIILRISLLAEELPEIVHLRLAPVRLSATPGTFFIGQTLIDLSDRA